MSRTTLLYVYKTKAVWDLELNNSWGSAFVLWNYLHRKYYKEPIGLMSIGVNRLYNDINEFTDSEKCGLVLCSDRGVILKKHLTKAFILLAKLSKEITLGTDRNYVNHWLDISEWCEKARHNKDPRLIGIALNCTSVADVWDDYPKCLNGIIYRDSSDCEFLD